VTKTYGLPQWTLTGQGSLGIQGTYIASEGESSITDDPAPSQKVKTVTHTKRHLSRLAIDSYDEHTSTNRYVYTGFGAHWNSWGNYGAIWPDNVVVSYPVTLAQQKAQAMHQFYNMNQTDNLLNVVESEQLVSSVTSLRNLIARLRAGKILQIKQNLDTRVLFSRKIPGIKTLDFSNLYLMWQFGFAPLISDMTKCFAAVKTLRRDMQRAVSNAGKPYTITVRCDGVHSIVGTSLHTLTGYNAVYSPLNSSYCHSNTVMFEPPHRIVGVEGIRTIKYSMASFQKLDYLMARFLTPGPASLIWERIPFSFVIDWFVNLSGIIDSLNNTLTGGTKQIKKCWWSEKYHMNVNAVKHSTSAWSSDSDGSSTVVNELSYYHREALDTNISLVPSGRFGKKQALLSAALLHQLVASLKR